MKFFAALVGCSILLACGPSGPPAGPPETLRSYSLGSIEGVLTQDGVVYDAAQSSDGDGSLRIEKEGSIRLFETGDVPAEKSRLTYSAKLRTQDLDGRAYLEMWCNYPGHGEFFSRALNSPVSGTTDWVSQQTPFILQAGQDCDNVKLNVVVEGSGTVWIDDLRLERIAL